MRGAGPNRRIRGLLVAMIAAGCAAPTGGWDVNRLLEEMPELASLPDQRIGDLTPYPAWTDGRLIGVVCRFDKKESITIQGGGPGWSPEWAHRAVAAVEQSVAGVQLELSTSDEFQIEVQSIEAPNAEGPSGLGDTLALCDVSPDGGGKVPGRMLRAVIRLRRALPLPTGRIYRASEAEWIGALLHEFGHSLGFAGHAAVGDSLVHLEQSRLRALGRLAISGATISTPNLTALYQLDPGRELIELRLGLSGADAFADLQTRIEEREERLGPALRVVSIAGDRQARLRWEWAGGLSLAIDFPDWRREVSAGNSVSALLSQATQRSFDRER